ncbi:MAG: type IV toxin-antitoxin system AbiEi family antitoxin [Gammaproteobacteria bacterium]|nr:type IV toxin-antitoxin system AbiEi family antitoxin [Gammaproteobacteria bacterium]
MQESELLHKAITAFNRETGLDLRVLQSGMVPLRGDSADAILELPERDMKFHAVIKQRAATLNVGALLQQLSLTAEPHERLLIAGYINPKLATKLKEANVQFIDAAGNAFICRPPIYVNIKGNRKNDEWRPERQTLGTAFKPTGLKVIFALINDPDLINAPYRRMANIAQVALGNIGLIIRDLASLGFVEEGLNTKLKKIIRLNVLLNKWVEEYPMKLKPKLILGRYTTENPNWYADIDPVDHGAQWGGELAAYKLTHYLTPKQYVVYLDRGKLNDFLQAAKLKKLNTNNTENTEIVVLEKFWQNIEGHLEKSTVPPALIYADLVETGNTRNLEAAERILEQYFN